MVMARATAVEVVARHRSPEHRCGLRSVRAHGRVARGMSEHGPAVRVHSCPSEASSSRQCSRRIQPGAVSESVFSVVNCLTSSLEVEELLSIW